MMRAVRVLIPALLLALAGTSAATAAELAIIIDDVGYRLDQAERVAALPGPLAVAVLPDAPRAARAASLAFASGKEVLLHLPLQAAGDAPHSEMTVTLDTSEQRLDAIVADALRRVPHVTGINSHMGSLLTRHPGHMAWLMRAMKRHSNLYFIDSYTTEKSVALAAAAEAGLPALRRHVFLDAEQTPAAIRSEFDRAVAMARRQGYAIAIGHPYPETLALLNELLPTLEDTDVELVPVADLIERYGSPAAVAARE